ncbi:glycosyltransferase family 2 protein [Winogradskyella flava]|uniref:glycosyltransferase family 2 protein n=1 Tax=Winogradskyella flava TaxID=1884876 RepID=UPI00248FD6C1|nr:glycosyltransferase [Winogradskyella flava]
MSKVSIIIPSFNSKSFIEETLNSVYNQTYKNIEIIVVDDGSTDGSVEFVRSVSKENVRVVQNYRKGACAARNYGLDIASGDYIQFLDADDVLSSSKIESQINLASKYGQDNIYSCGWSHFNNQIDTARYYKQDIDKDYSSAYTWLNDSWLGKGMGQTSIWLTHRDLIKKAGLWDESLMINQDGEFFSRVIMNAKEIRFSEQGMVYYRKGNEESVSQKNNKSLAKVGSLLRSYILYKEHANSNNLTSFLNEGLANNFLNFIYQYHDLFPEFVEQAEAEFYDLGYKKMWAVGGESFKTFANFFGFKRALKLRSLLK